MTGQSLAKGSCLGVFNYPDNGFKSRKAKEASRALQSKTHGLACWSQAPRAECLQGTIASLGAASPGLLGMLFPCSATQGAGFFFMLGFCLLWFGFLFVCLSVGFDFWWEFCLGFLFCGLVCLFCFGFGFGWFCFICFLGRCSVGCFFSLSLLSFGLLFWQQMHFVKTQSGGQV